MVTVAEDADGVARAVAGGARGYVVKDATREEMAASIVYALSDVAWRRAIPAQRTAEGQSSTPAPALTERELQVLTGMSRGRSNSEIGKELFLSEDTVKTHARRLFRKLSAADRAQAVALGFRWGLVR
jgi:DNA-binding NarL/FixJ family response regulator